MRPPDPNPKEGLAADRLGWSEGAPPPPRPRKVSVRENKTLLSEDGPPVRMSSALGSVSSGTPGFHIRGPLSGSITLFSFMQQFPLISINRVSLTEHYHRLSNSIATAQ